ncbi:hypothetical protein [Roseomonas chloroacetimidivorans]|uniref:hypothetical protein n=1 Tax=Roseomonas chloroacetimidivorans TaxID=1766656 RepID=UPI003C792156
MGGKEAATSGVKPQRRRAAQTRPADTTRHDVSSSGGAEENRAETLLSAVASLADAGAAAMASAATPAVAAVEAAALTAANRPFVAPKLSAPACVLGF